jgi:hypothetical protein
MKVIKSGVFSMIAICLMLANSALFFNLVVRPALAYSAGETKVYSGILIKNPNPKYVYALQDKNVNIITGNTGYFDTLIGKSVDVKVTFTGDGNKFKIVSITSSSSTNSGSTTPTTATNGSIVGYLRVAPATSGFDYYLMDSNSDTGSILRRAKVSTANKVTWDKFVNQKVKMSYTYSQQSNGRIVFWNATLVSAN